MKLMNARGMNDFSPEEKIARNELIDLLRGTFERFGFSPMETPIVERMDILAAKYAGGAEIMKETFSFRDQGKRELGLRYDLTVPLARFIGMNPTIKLPFKRYMIGEVFRDGPVKLGRMRQFMQCDVDTVGTASMLADAECIKIAQSVFAELKFDVTIEVNNRKLLNGILKSCEIPENRWGETILEIDKMKKIGMESVVKELQAKGIRNEATTKLIEILGTKGSNFEKLEKLKRLCDSREAADGIKEMESLLSFIDENNVKFSLGLARGLAYYTGTVFETFINTKEIESSLCAGGRYDKIIGDYIGSNKEFPAVGISFGMEPILAALEKKGKASAKKRITELYIVPIQTLDESQKIVDKLRAAGINTEIDLMDRSISKNLAFANSQSIPFVGIIGGDELQQKKVKIKDMVSGEESLLSIKELIKKLSR
ncbi:MAG: histidine--tRNA ligase [Candidatus Nanoarchaeia archaeon]